MTHDADATRSLLAAHAARYPGAQVQDYLKFLFQSSFGCEHLIADPSAAAAYIRREAAQAVPHAGELIEPLDGPYCRVHLDVLRDGLSPDTLAALFARSAAHHPEGAQALEAKLVVLLDMARAGELPIDPADAAARIDAWRAAGFPACHHSEAFRAAYAPAYRLLRADYARLLPLFAAIDRRMADGGPVTLAIDGSCASGKTTLAELLSQLYGCRIFHMDDFFLRPEQRTPERYAEPGGNVDRERFAAEVLAPLAAREVVQLRRFDCGSMTLLPPEPVTPTPLTVVEGSYALHPTLRGAYDLSVFLTVPPDEQLRRIAARNGDKALRMFIERWIPLEQRYYDACRPDLACDLVIE